MGDSLRNTAWLRESNLSRFRADFYIVSFDTVMAVIVVSRGEETQADMIIPFDTPHLSK